MTFLFRWTERTSEKRERALGLRSRTLNLEMKKRAMLNEKDKRSTSVACLSFLTLFSPQSGLLFLHSDSVPLRSSSRQQACIFMSHFSSLCQRPFPRSKAGDPRSTMKEIERRCQRALRLLKTLTPSNLTTLASPPKLLKNDCHYLWSLDVYRWFPFASPSARARLVKRDLVPPKERARSRISFALLRLPYFF
jgi:hypothetical protein